MLDAVDSAATDINRAVAATACGDRRHPDRHRQGGQPTRAGQRARTPPSWVPRATPRSRPSRRANANGTADPLGAFTQLTKADAELDRLLATVSEERAAAERMSRAFDQALFTAQSRVRGGVGLHRHPTRQHRARGPDPAGRSGPPARRGAGHDARRNLVEAIAHANGAAMLAAQAQSLANADVNAAQRSYTGRYGGGGGSNMGAMLGGIIIGNILSGALRGGGGSVGGGWSSTSFGGSGGGGGGGGFRGGGGRF